MRNDLIEILKQFTRPVEPDAVLLDRFVDTQDARAFAELVQRHGGLVWSQCRLMLGTSADAEDAFQATFLVLMQKGKQLGPSVPLGPWLHGVAHRVCLNARRSKARQLRREQAVAKPEAAPEPPEPDWEETLAAVHAEIHRLPESLRIPFVMCYLEGKSTTQAASELGLKLGTFSSRVSRAKDRIIAQMTRRGCVVAVLWSALAANATSAPPALVNRVVEGFSTASAVVPATVLALTHGVGSVGTSSVKLLAATVIVGLSLTMSSVGWWSRNLPAAVPPATPASAKPIEWPEPPTKPGDTPAPETEEVPVESPSEARVSQWEYRVLVVADDPSQIEGALQKLQSDEPAWEIVALLRPTAGGRVQIYLKRPGAGSVAVEWEK